MSRWFRRAKPPASGVSPIHQAPQVALTCEAGGPPAPSEPRAHARGRYRLASSKGQCSSAFSAHDLRELRSQSEARVLPHLGRVEPQDDIVPRNTLGDQLVRDRSRCAVVLDPDLVADDVDVHDRTMNPAYSVP